MTSAAASRAKMAAPRSNVDVVIDRLHPDILASLFGQSYPHDPTAISRRACLVATANEALRLLTAKRAFLGPRDAAIVRAGMVVDYLARNAPSSSSTTAESSSKRYRRAAVPVSTLAGAVGFSTSTRDKRSLEVMQTVVASHLDGSSVGKRRRRRPEDGNDDDRRVDGRGTGGRRDAPTSAPYPVAASTGSRPTTPLRPTDLIRDLCIRLGPAIPDAVSAASCALEMFRRLASGGCDAGRRGRSYEDDDDDDDDDHRGFSAYELRRDMRRHQEYYEAACFFLAVKRIEGDNCRYFIRGSNRNRTAAAAAAAGGNSKATKKDDGRGDGADGSDEDGGGVDDDVDDERHLTEMDVITEANLLEGTFSTVLGCVRDLTNGMSISLTVAGDRAGGMSGGSSALFKVAGEKCRNDGGTGMDPPRSAFEQWKERVLREAKVAATKEIGRRDDGDWLTRAADQVLQKAGLQ